MSDIQDYFEYIIKKHETLTDNPPIWIYRNRIQNRIAFKIKTAYYLELLILEIVKTYESAENKVTKDKSGGNINITEVILVYLNLFNTSYQQNSRVFYTFVPNKPCGHVLKISLK